MKDIIQQAQDVIGDNLILLATYGKIEKYMVVVVKNLTFADIEEIKPFADMVYRAFKKQPLVLTQEEISAGTDVFPLEFLNIKTTIEVIYGSDVFKDLSLEKKYVRRELEFEFRSKLINLRQGILEAKRDKELSLIVNKSLPTLMPIFNGLLYLKGKTIPDDLKEMLNKLSDLYKLDFSVLTSSGAIKEKVDTLVMFLGKLGKAIDTMKV